MTNALKVQVPTAQDLNERKQRIEARAVHLVFEAICEFLSTRKRFLVALDTSTLNGRLLSDPEMEGHCVTDWLKDKNKNKDSLKDKIKLKLDWSKVAQPLKNLGYIVDSIYYSLEADGSINYKTLYYQLTPLPEIAPPSYDLSLTEQPKIVTDVTNKSRKLPWFGKLLFYIQKKSVVYLEYLP